MYQGSNYPTPVLTPAEEAELRAVYERIAETLAAEDEECDGPAFDVGDPVG